MNMHTETIEYFDAGVRCIGYVAYETAGSALPVVLVSHTWRGRDEFVENKVRQLAQMGYVGFAIDMFGEGRRGTTAAECEALIKPLVEDRSSLMRRIGAAVTASSQLGAGDPQRIAAIGYCFGGMCVLDLARSGTPVRGVISLHGLLTPTDVASATIRAKVLAVHGNDDPLVAESELQRFREQMTAAKADWQLHIYGGTKHAFTNPAATDPNAATFYSSTAERRSWQTVTAFLDELFAAPGR